jgi:hypothetical protein
MMLQVFGVPSAISEEATGDDDEILAEVENPEVALADGVPETEDSGLEAHPQRTLTHR